METTLGSRDACLLHPHLKVAMLIKQLEDPFMAVDTASPLLAPLRSAPPSHLLPHRPHQHTTLSLMTLSWSRTPRLGSRQAKATSSPGAFVRHKQTMIGEAITLSGFISQVVEEIEQFTSQLGLFKFIIMCRIGAILDEMQFFHCDHMLMFIVLLC